jgi:acyl-CoA dehydrogenase
MVTLGSRLKQKGKLTGRFADALSWMYLALCALRRYEAEGRRAEDLPLVQWGCETSLAQVQAAFEGIRQNFDVPVLGFLLRGPAALWSRLNPVGAPPSDRLGKRIARLITTPGPVRDRLAEDVYVPTDAHGSCIERAFRLRFAAAPAIDKVREASRTRRLAGGPPESLLDAAVEASVLTRAEADLVREAAAAREDAVQVDTFTEEEYRRPANDPVEADNLAVR